MANKDNPGNGARFEAAVGQFFVSHGLNLSRGFPIDVGFGTKRKPHSFDLGQSDPKILVECKRQFSFSKIIGME